MSKRERYLWIGVLALLTGCTQKILTTPQHPQQTEYEHVRIYCSEASDRLRRPPESRHNDPQGPLEFEIDVIGYDECMQRYWPDSPEQLDDAE